MKYLYKTNKNRKNLIKINYLKRNNICFHNVIIPVFNRFDLALESLVSVIFQNVYYVKLVVIDDASSKDFFYFFNNNLNKLLCIKKNLENYLERVFNKEIKYIKIKNIKYKNLNNKYKQRRNELNIGDIKYIKKVILEVYLLDENRKHIREVIFIRNKENFGPGKSRDIGLKFVDNGIVSFLDSDDLYMPERLDTLENFLEETVNYKNSNKKEKIKFGENYLIFAIQNKDYYLYNDKLVNLNKKHFKPSGYIFLDSIKQNRISIPSFSILKEDLKFMKNFYGEDLFNKIPVMEDYYFYLKLTFISEVRLIEKRLSIIRKWDNIESQTKINQNYEYYRLISLYNFFIKLVIFYNSGVLEDLRIKKLFILINENKNIILNEIIFKFNVWLKGTLKREKYDNKLLIKFLLLILILFEIF